MKARWLQVLEKSVAAAVSAIEIYNKPDFKYRSETFSILMTNAWELLLKAKILRDNKNDLRSIQIREKRRLKDGSFSKKLYVRRTRSNNPATLPIGKAINKVLKSDPSTLDQRVVENLNLLIEVRDNSIHLVNKNLGLQTRLQDIGTASLKNYIQLVQEWFDYDLSHYNFYLMPLSFFHEADVIESFSVRSHNEQTRNLLNYLENVEQAHPSDAVNPYNATLRIETKFLRSSSQDAIEVRTTTDPDAPKVQITEEDMLKRYPYDYQTLSEKLKDRYGDFKQNQKYHGIRKSLKDDKKYCLVRLLNPTNRESTTRKEYYSTEVLKVFDEHYTKK
jgi:hypothetical protein